MSQTQNPDIEPRPRSRLVNDFLMMFSGGVAARAVVLLAMPALSRLYSPEAIGQWQLFVSLFLILVPIGTWRYELAIILPDDDEEATPLFWICVASSLGMAALWSCLALFFSRPIAELLGVPGLGRFLWLIPVLNFAFGVEQACVYWLTRHGRFAVLAPTRIARSLAIVAVPLTAALLSRGSVSYLILGTTTGYLLVAAVLCLLVAFGADPVAPSALSWPRLRQAAVRYRNYPLVVAPYHFIAQFSVRFMLFLLAIYTNPHVVGLVAMALQLTHAPISVISLSLSQVFYPELVRDLKKESLHKFVHRVLNTMAIVATPLFALFAFYATDILGWVLAERWREAGPFAASLAVASSIWLLTAWLNHIYNASGRQRLEVFLEVIYNTSSIIVLFLLLRGGASPQTAVATFCAITIVYNMIWLSVGFRVAGIPLTKLVLPAAHWLVLGSSTLSICWASGKLLPAGYAPWVATLLALALQIAIAYNWKRVARSKAPSSYTS